MQLTAGGFHTAEALRMGSVDQRQRVDGATIHLTLLDVGQLDPTPLYRVKHVAWIELNGSRMMVARRVSLHENVQTARAEFLRTHAEPPTTIED